MDLYTEWYRKGYARKSKGKTIGFDRQYRQPPPHVEKQPLCPPLTCDADDTQNRPSGIVRVSSAEAAPPPPPPEWRTETRTVGGRTVTTHLSPGADRIDED